MANAYKIGVCSIIQNDTTLPDGDRLYCMCGVSSPTQVRLGLELDRDVSWWKGIGDYPPGSSGGPDAFLYVGQQDSHLPKYVTIEYASARQRHLGLIRMYYVQCDRC